MILTVRFQVRQKLSIAPRVNWRTSSGLSRTFQWLSGFGVIFKYFWSSVRTRWHPYQLRDYYTSDLHKRSSVTCSLYEFVYFVHVNYSRVWMLYCFFGNSVYWLFLSYVLMWACHILIKVYLLTYLQTVMTQPTPTFDNWHGHILKHAT